MTSNAFNRPHAAPSSPSYCYSHHSCLPQPPPGDPAPILNGYARWTDLDPEAPIDVAIYTPMPHLGAGWVWRGSVTKGTVTLQITLSRLIAPQPWAIQIDVWDQWRNPETYIWMPLVIQLEPAINTRLQTFVHLPGLDFRQARVTQ